MFFLEDGGRRLYSRPSAGIEGRRKRRSRAELSSRRWAMGDVIKFPGRFGAVYLIRAKQALGRIFLFAS